MHSNAEVEPFSRLCITEMVTLQHSSIMRIVHTHLLFLTEDGCDIGLISKEADVDPPNVKILDDVAIVHFLPTDTFNYFAIVMTSCHM